MACYPFFFNITRKDTTMSDPVTTLSQQNLPEQHKVRDVSTILSKLEPDLYPLDTILRRMKKGPAATQTKIEWARTVSLPRTDTIAADSAAGSAGAAKVITVTTPNMWRIDDIIITPGSVTNPPLLVTAVNYTNGQVTVYALDQKSTVNVTGYGTVPALTTGDVIAWLGNSKAEGFTQSYSRAQFPTYDYNYCELSDTIVDVTLTRKNTKNYTEDDWKRARREQLKEFRRSLEYKRWFGIRSEVKDPTDPTKDRWTMHGITRFLSKKFNYDKDATGTKITEAMLIDWLASAFGGNNGSPSRFLFADTWLMAELAKCGLTNRRNLKNEVVLGIKVGMVQTDFGTLFLKHHRGFNEMGKEHYGVIVDMAQVYNRELRPMERKELKLQDIGTDKDAEQYKEQASQEVRNPECHAVIEGD